MVAHNLLCFLILVNSDHGLLDLGLKPLVLFVVGHHHRGVRKHFCRSSERGELARRSEGGVSVDSAILTGD